MSSTELDAYELLRTERRPEPTNRAAIVAVVLFVGSLLVMVGGASVIVAMNSMDVPARGVMDSPL